jgi:hypothetical protein
MEDDDEACFNVGSRGWTASDGSSGMQVVVSLSQSSASSSDSALSSPARLSDVLHTCVAFELARRHEPRLAAAAMNASVPAASPAAVAPADQSASAEAVAAAQPAELKPCLKQRTLREPAQPAASSSSNANKAVSWQPNTQLLQAALFESIETSPSPFLYTHEERSQKKREYKREKAQLQKQQRNHSSEASNASSSASGAAGGGAADDVDDDANDDALERSLQLAERNMHSLSSASYASSERAAAVEQCKLQLPKPDDERGNGDEGREWHRGSPPPVFRSPPRSAPIVLVSPDPPASLPHRPPISLAVLAATVASSSLASARATVASASATAQAVPPRASMPTLPSSAARGLQQQAMMRFMNGAASRVAAAPLLPQRPNFTQQQPQLPPALRLPPEDGKLQSQQRGASAEALRPASSFSQRSSAPQRQSNMILRLRDVSGPRNLRVPSSSASVASASSSYISSSSLSSAFRQQRTRRVSDTLSAICSDDDDEPDQTESARKRVKLSVTMSGSSGSGRSSFSPKGSLPHKLQPSSPIPEATLSPTQPPPPMLPVQQPPLLPVLVRMAEQTDTASSSYPPLYAPTAKLTLAASPPKPAMMEPPLSQTQAVQQQPSQPQRSVSMQQADQRLPQTATQAQPMTQARSQQPPLPHSMSGPTSESVPSEADAPVHEVFSNYVHLSGVDAATGKQIFSCNACGNVFRTMWKNKNMDAHFKSQHPQLHMNMAAAMAPIAESPITAVRAPHLMHVPTASRVMQMQPSHSQPWSSQQAMHQTQSARGTMTQQPRAQMQTQKPPASSFEGSFSPYSQHVQPPALPQMQQIGPASDAPAMTAATARQTTEPRRSGVALAATGAPFPRVAPRALATVVRRGPGAVVRPKLRLSLSEAPSTPLEGCFVRHGTQWQCTRCGMLYGLHSTDQALRMHMQKCMRTG